MRKYYMACLITCDECGNKDYLDDGNSLGIDDLDRYIAGYYTLHKGKDLCNDCKEKYEIF